MTTKNPEYQNGQVVPTKTGDMLVIGTTYYLDGEIGYTTAISRGFGEGGVIRHVISESELRFIDNRKSTD